MSDDKDKEKVKENLKAIEKQAKKEAADLKKEREKKGHLTK